MFAKKLHTFGEHLKIFNFAVRQKLAEICSFTFCSFFPPYGTQIRGFEFEFGPWECQKPPKGGVQISGKNSAIFAPPPVGLPTQKMPYLFFYWSDGEIKNSGKKVLLTLSFFHIFFGICLFPSVFTPFL